MADNYDLQRFVAAQAPKYAAVVSELRAGQKRTHWMWFIFPQVAGLGRSANSIRYAISSLAEARAYLAHPMLRARLNECARLVLRHHRRTATQILGSSTDSKKLHSSMTLFARAAEDPALFQEVLDRYFGGRPDPLTIEKLGAEP